MKKIWIVTQKVSVPGGHGEGRDDYLAVRRAAGAFLSKAEAETWITNAKERLEGSWGWSFQEATEILLR